jgi:hypothetical protein
MYGAQLSTNTYKPVSIMKGRSVNKTAYPPGKPEASEKPDRAICACSSIGLGFTPHLKNALQKEIHHLMAAVPSSNQGNKKKKVII